MIIRTLILLLLIPSVCSSAISFVNDKWESSLDCASMAGCDGMDVAGASIGCGSSSLNTSYNNPLGTGKGLEQFVGDGQNIGSQRYEVYFGSSLNDVWIRYYIKYESGYHWEFLGYDKLIYLSNGYVFEWYGANQIRFTNGNVEYVDNGGWDDTMSCGSTGSVNDPACDGDGEWHTVEIYIKAGTGTGIYRAWIDGVLAASHTGGTFIAPTSVELFGNQNNPVNSGGCASVYQDDFAIYRSTPPLIDASGNPMIGLIGTTPTPIDGVCGSADGGSFSTAPSANLCSVGIAGDISGDGPWTWPCNGINGGSNVSCSATLLLSGITWLTPVESSIVITDPVTGNAIGPPQ